MGIQLEIENPGSQPTIRSSVSGWCREFTGRNLSGREFTLLLVGDPLISWERLDDGNWVKMFLLPFLERPSALLRSAEGSFAGVVLDRSSGDCWLFNDPFGNVALHVYTTPQQLLVGTDMLRLASRLQTTNVDEESWLQLLGLGFALGGRTIMEGIQRVEAGSLMSVRAGVCRSERYADYSYTELKRPCALEDFVEVLRCSVKAALEFDPIVAVTAGYDTRVVLAATESLKKHPRTYTHGYPSSHDVQIARRILHEHLHNHTEYLFTGQDVPAFSEHWHRAVIETEGHMSPDAAIGFASWEYLAARGERSVLDAHGGAILRRQILKGRSIRTLGSSSAAELLYSNYRTPLLKSQRFPSALTKRIEDACREGVHRAVLGHSTYSCGENLIDLFYLHEVNAGRIAYAGNAQIERIGMLHPLLSQSLNGVARTIPLRLRRSNTAYRYAIQRLSPRLSAYPMDDAGLLVPYRGFGILRYLPQIVDRTLNTLHRTLRTPQSHLRKHAYDARQAMRASGLALQTLIEELPGQLQAIASSAYQAFGEAGDPKQPELSDALRIGLFVAHVRNRGLPLPTYLE